MFRKVAIAVCVSVLCATSTLDAQYRRSSLISQVDASRYGLERMWFTRVQVDTARGRLAHITHHINSTVSHTIYEVEYDGGILKYSERDLDRFGAEIGKEQAERLANRKAEDLNRRNLNAKVVTHTVPQSTFYVVTDRGVVQAVDSETGRSRWTTSLGNPFYPTESPGANDEFVAVVNGSSLFLLNAADGGILAHRRTKGAPGAGPAISDQLVFVPMVNGAIEAYLLDDFSHPPHIFKSHGRALVQPTFTGSMVTWPTDRGHLYVTEANRDNILFRIETNNQVVAPATPLPPNLLLVVSTDGYVYCVHQSTGSIRWRFSTGEPISQSAVVIGDAIYLVTDDRSMFRIAAEDGRQQWWIKDVDAFVAASDTRLYCRSGINELVILDAASGARYGRLATGASDVFVTNPLTDRMVLASRTGVVQCLREIQHDYPLIHASLREKPEKPERARPAPVDDQPSAPPPKVDNPFGTGGDSEANPFGGGENPFGGGGGDPFGTGSSGGDSSGGDSSGANPFGGADPFGTP